MNYFIFNIFLALTWSMLNSEINLPNLFTGFLLGYLVLYIGHRAIGPSPYFGRVNAMVRFLFFFLWELLVSNLKLAREVLTPTFRMKPRIVAIPLSVKADTEITALANLISLTPGTLSLDVSADRSMLYVHFINAEDEEKVKQEIKNGMEHWIKDLSSQGEE